MLRLSNAVRKPGSNDTLPLAEGQSPQFGSHDGSAAAALLKLQAAVDGNYAPEVDLNGDDDGTSTTLTYVAGDPRTPIAPVATVVDVDNPSDFASGVLTVQISSGGSAGDTIYIASTDFTLDGTTLSYFGVPIGTLSGPGSASTPLTVTFNGNASPAIVQELIQAISFSNSLATPAEGDRIVTYTLSDGDGGTSAPVTATVSVFDEPPPPPANDPPVIDLNGADPGTSASLSYAEGQPVTPVAPTATVTDPDSPADFAGGTLTVAITTGGNPSDALRLTGAFTVEDGDLIYAGSIMVGTWGGGTDYLTPLVVTFNANATPAIVEELVRSIGFLSLSEATVSGSRILTYTLSDGDGGTSNAATATITVTADDDAAIAIDDHVATSETQVYTGNVLVDNGFGPDIDPDGPPIQVTQVNGMAVVGQTITLTSGARLRLNADGSFTYDPNGQFNALAAVDSGAANTSASDQFTYTITGGATATVTVLVNGEGGNGDVALGDGGDNIIFGTEAPDQFRLQQGGGDQVVGLGGNDGFYFGAAFTPADFVNGGGGNDVLILQGDYSAGITFGTGTVSNIVSIEAISLVPGYITFYGDTAGNFYNYNLTMLDSNVAAGATLKVNGNFLRLGESFTFDGSAETDGSFLIFAGGCTDHLVGGAKGDLFVFGHDGRFEAFDYVDGGAGYDVFYLRGDYTIDFNDFGFDSSLANIESIGLISATDTQFVSGGDGEFDYDITWNDDLLDAGLTLAVNGSRLTHNETMIFDGSWETDGSFRIFGGAADDVLIGGCNDDLIYGGLGADTLIGNCGADIFRYYSTAESNQDGQDVIIDFESGDLIDLVRIDAISGTAVDDAFTFIGSAAFSNQAGQLRAVQAGLSGLWTVSGDTNGDGNADFQIIVGVFDNHPIVGADFLL